MFVIIKIVIYNKFWLRNIGRGGERGGIAPNMGNPWGHMIYLKNHLYWCLIVANFQWGKSPQNQREWEQEEKEEGNEKKEERKEGEGETCFWLDDVKGQMIQEEK